MSSLFDENFKYTNVANQIEHRCSPMIVDTFSKYYNLGFSPREIAVVLHNLITEVELETIIENDAKEDE